MKNIIYLIIFLTSLQFYAQNTISTNRFILKEKIGVNNQNFILDGFYYSKRIHVKSENDTANYISPIIFFEDGTAMNFDFIGNSSNTIRVKEKGKKCILKPRQDFETIIDFFRCYAEIFERKEIYTVYSIEGNILRIQSLGPKFFVENRGIVINDSTFVINLSINYLTREFVNKNYTYQFQASKKPDSTKFEPTSKIKKYFLE
ncbi:hypothetical protein [Gillisia sp. JM1]|uniref:hypothetical protein n=1 Tax=Gillisia sp. JM1 TaxID=1283286 RepID=UPI0004109AFB|nr:hypothetical protein [Gillisia sp. JM1]